MTWRIAGRCQGCTLAMVSWTLAFPSTWHHVLTEANYHSPGFITHQALRLLNVFCCQYCFIASWLARLRSTDPPISSCIDKYMHKPASEQRHTRTLLFHKQERTQSNDNNRTTRRWMDGWLVTKAANHVAHPESNSHCSVPRFPASTTSDPNRLVSAFRPSLLR